MPYDHHAYSREYSKENYSRLTVYIYKKDLQEVRNLAEKEGLSVSELFLSALNIAYGVDLRKEKMRE